MRSSFPNDLLSNARRGIPFPSGDGQAFVRLDDPSGGFLTLPVRSLRVMDLTRKPGDALCKMRPSNPASPFQPTETEGLPAA